MREADRQWLEDEIIRRQDLGEYNADSAAILRLLEILYHHLRTTPDEAVPSRKKK